MILLFQRVQEEDRFCQAAAHEHPDEAKGRGEAGEPVGANRREDQRLAAGRGQDEAATGGAAEEAQAGARQEGETRGVGLVGLNLVCFLFS